MIEANIVLPMKNHWVVFSFFLLLTLWCEGSRAKEIIKVGVIVDMKSPVGKIAESCIHMAISDFYAANPNYLTKIALSWRDSKADVIAALSAALDLIGNEKVHAIIGPQYSSEAKLLANLGRKAQVPIVSFSATSPSISRTGNQYLIRTARNDSFQVKALVDIVQNYGWQDIVLIYEDTENGNGLVPFLLDAFQEINARVSYRISIPLFSNETEISKQLEKLKTMEKYVFLVHTAASVGSKLFMAAKKMGMMNDGYAWLVTQGLSKVLDPVSAEVRKYAMQGVLGLKPFVPETKEIADFRSRWKKHITMNKLENQMKELSLYGLLAYDTTWAVAMAVENAGILQPRYSKPIANDSKVDIVHLGVSETGPRILNSIKNISFHRLSGDFRLQNGELAPSKFEVFNVVGNTERIIGFWTRDQGLSKSENCSISYQSSKNRLKKPIWPGDPADNEQPRKLRIGVPYLTGAFNKFVKVEWDSNNNTNVSGVTVDIFSNAVGLLPFPVRYEFIPYVNESRQKNGTTDDMLKQIKCRTSMQNFENFDAVVADATIVDYRTSYVDFTLPYTESGVGMLVRTKDDERENIWIFLKPLRWDLWLFAGLGFIFTGFVVWVLEHRINTEFRGSPRQQIGTIFWFSFSTLFFAHRERVMSNWTRFIVIIWFFVVLILSQSYTASLASMLTVRRMQPTVIDVKEILRNDLSVGYQDVSFVKDFLIKNLNFKEDMLKGYKTPEEYREALLKGTRNGGVDAVIDELPYLKIFLAKYCSNFQIVGPTYQTAGFGFAFPIGSPLVSHMSKATLNVTQNKTLMDRIEKDNGDEKICEEERSTSSSDSLNLSSFGGLFIITGVATTSAFLIYAFRFLRSHWPKEGPFKMRLVELANHFDHKKDSSTRDHNIRRSDSRVHPETSLHSTDNINVVVDDNLASENNNNAN